MVTTGLFNLILLPMHIAYTSLQIALTHRATTIAAAASPFVALPGSHELGADQTSATTKDYGLSSGTASDSICPKGWRLPGYDGDGSYYDLVERYVSRSSTSHDANSDTVMLISPLSFIRSGYYFYVGDLKYNAEVGLYAYSRFNSAIISHNMVLAYNYLKAQNYNNYSYNRGSGYSLRCLAR